MRSGGDLTFERLRVVFALTILIVWVVSVAVSIAHHDPPDTGLLALMMLAAGAVLGAGVIKRGGD